MRRKELQSGQLVGETVDPWRMNGWWRDVTGWDLLRISGSSWMKPVTCTYLPSIFLFGKVIFTLLGQLGKSLSWRWKVGEICPKWVETLVTLAYPDHLHYPLSIKLLCKGITTMASTYKIAGSPSKLLNHQLMIGKNRHIIHQFHFILQRTQRFGEIGWMEGFGGTSESKLPGQWVRNIPNASTAVGEIISGGILGESNASLKVIIKCDVIWKVWIWAFQFLFFFRCVEFIEP